MATSAGALGWWVAVTVPVTVAAAMVVFKVISDIE
jgi:hypothetical protein